MNKTNESFVDHYFFHSRLGERKVRLWLPPNYSENNLYVPLVVFDGEMIFLPHQTWNGLSWNIQKDAEKLIRDDSIKPCVIIGIESGGQEQRYQELLPENVYKNLTPRQRSLLNSALYKDKLMIPSAVVSNTILNFVVKDVLPFIRENYAISAKKQDSYIMGSSMGGLAALYAVCEHPDTFAGAGCLSTHWPGVLPTANMKEIQTPPVSEQLISYFTHKLKTKTSHRLYFDFGDQGLDEEYPRLQEKMNSALDDIQYPQTLRLSKYFPGDGHTEKEWGARVHEALKFLLGCG